MSHERTDANATLPSPATAGQHPHASAATPRHRLDPDKIVETATNLARDMASHLPGTTLAALADELRATAMNANTRSRRAREPIVAIRLLSAVAIVAGLLGLWFLITHIHAKWEFATVNELFDGVHTGFELLVIFGGALWFCATLEARIKRKAALAALEELREFIHVIDVTQLYYTPNLYRSRPDGGAKSQQLDENYLLYSTQMLAVISNLAPLYTRGVPGDSVLRAASDVEMLAIAVASKQMTKAEFVRDLQR